ncbi:MAG: hypothetical protein HY420_01705, partial [Candidatus Kerfeldbacteria bacterium]|nr:hypothetical protein [Candidatus Kerfeldbacteria bacterium]
TDQGIAAYYAADAGVERALFTVFNNRIAGSDLGGETSSSALKNLTFVQVKYDLPFLTPLLPGHAYGLSGSTLTQNPIGSKTVGLLKDQSVQLDLFDPDSPFNNVTLPAPKSITLKSIGLANGAWAEVRWTYGLRSNVASDVQPANATVRLITTANLADGATINFFTGNVTAVSGSIENPIGITPQPASEGEIAGYSVRITALNNDIPNLNMAVCADNNAPCSPYQIPGDIHIKSRGRVGQALTQVEATVPWRLPTIGLFDYVIFSEERLDKPG